jgi:hypothetical protein
MATKTIGATGRDYSTHSAWITYLDALTFSGAEIGQAYNDGEFLEGLNFVSGITNGANRITLTAAAGQGFADHASKTTNALKYNVSNGAGVLGTTGGGGSTIIVDIAHLTITRMQFKRTANYNYLLEMTGGSSDGIFTDCIFHHDTAGGSGGAVILNASVATNCLIIANGAAGIECRPAHARRLHRHQQHGCEDQGRHDDRPWKRLTAPRPWSTTPFSGSPPLRPAAPSPATTTHPTSRLASGPPIRRASPTPRNFRTSRPPPRISAP